MFYAGQLFEVDKFCNIVFFRKARNESFFMKTDTLSEVFSSENIRSTLCFRIAHLKTRGLRKSRMKSDIGDLISGYRSALSYNLTHLIRDLNQKLLGEVETQ